MFHTAAASARRRFVRSILRCACTCRMAYVTNFWNFRRDKLTLPACLPSQEASQEPRPPRRPLVPAGRAVTAAMHACSHVLASTFLGAGVRCPNSKRRRRLETVGSSHPGVRTYVGVRLHSVRSKIASVRGLDIPDGLVDRAHYWHFGHGTYGACTWPAGGKRHLSELYRPAALLIHCNDDEAGLTFSGDCIYRRPVPRRCSSSRSQKSGRADVRVSYS